MIRRELNFSRERLHFRGIIGTGGIGSGRFFVLKGNHTLGREESRSGRFLNINDYCKQHIILHYIRVLLGPDFDVIPLGKIGDDEEGKRLHREMTETGFDMKLIFTEPEVPTLFSFCFSYPDGSGGNLTTDDSASSRVDASFVEKALPEIKRLGTGGIIMAAPEVPLSARHRLIKMGKENGLYCTASFTSGEAEEVAGSDIIASTDLIAINTDEAAAFAGTGTRGKDHLAVAESAVKMLRKMNGKIMVSITAGREGSWCWDGYTFNRFPAIRADALSTAGAGDAFFAGIITGLALGLSLSEAQQLATLVAGLSVTSPDTINKKINRYTLSRFAKDSGRTFSDEIINLLEE
jgi:ribokinase